MVSVEIFRRSHVWPPAEMGRKQNRSYLLIYAARAQHSFQREGYPIKDAELQANSRPMPMDAIARSRRSHAMLRSDRMEVIKHSSSIQLGVNVVVVVVVVVGSGYRPNIGVVHDGWVTGRPTQQLSPKSHNGLRLPG